MVKEQMQPGSDCRLQVLPLAHLSSPAGVLGRSVRGSQHHLWTVEAPTAVLEASPPGSFCPLKHSECEGQTPTPGFPLLSLSKLRARGVWAPGLCLPPQRSSGRTLPGAEVKLLWAA